MSASFRSCGGRVRTARRRARVPETQLHDGGDVIRCHRVACSWDVVRPRALCYARFMSTTLAEARYMRDHMMDAPAPRTAFISRRRASSGAWRTLWIPVLAFLLLSSVLVACSPDVAP